MQDRMEQLIAAGVFTVDRRNARRWRTGRIRSVNRARIAAQRAADRIAEQQRQAAMPIRWLLHRLTLTNTVLESEVPIVDPIPRRALLAAAGLVHAVGDAWVVGPGTLDWILSQRFPNHRKAIA